MSAPAYRLPRPPEYFLERFADLHAAIRQAALGSLAGGRAHLVDRQTSADTIFAIDRHIEPVLERFFTEWAAELPLVVVAEGLGDERGPLGDGVALFGCTRVEDAALRIILDPIDGTRGLMYDKRPAWVLAGAATVTPGGGRLSDVDFAFLGELPTTKSGAIDQWWAARGAGAQGQRLDLHSQAATPLVACPSSATSLDRGFGMLSKFFPVGKKLLAEVEERMMDAVGLGGGQALVFDDQYISTGGQFAELIAGHDRFNADLRSWVYAQLGLAEGLCCHPYDLAGLLVAQEAGVILTDAAGAPLDGPLDVTTAVDWVAYANADLRRTLEPALQAAMRAAGRA